MEHKWQIIATHPEEVSMCVECGFITDDRLQVNCRGHKLANKDYIDAANDPNNIYD